MLPKEGCSHHNGNWEVNPVEKHFSIRCTRCGGILQRLTLAEAERSHIRPIKKWLAQRSPT